MQEIDNTYLFGLCQKHGTPLYVYDSQEIVQNYTTFKNAFKVDELKVHYACKALTNLSILRLMKELGAGLDCVSIHEVELGLIVGFAPQDIIYTPNGVALDEYDKAIALGVKITIDNIGMLERIGIAYPNQPVFVRINPHLMAGGSKKISVGHIDSKFGISIHQLPIVKRIVNRLNINVEGIHVHTGSDILDPDIFIRAAQLIFSVADQFDSINSIDFGSGFKIKYSESDLNTDIAGLGASFSEVFNAYCQERGRKLTLRFEPGKFLVSDAGYFFAKANVIKQTTSCTFVGIDTGFNHFIRPMFYDAYHEIENISNPKGQKKIYNIVGNICETDTFAEDRILNEVREDDILMFRNAGAYCFAMASTYNSRPKPAEILLHKGNDYVIRDRETLKDLLRNQKMPEIDSWL